MPKWYQSKIIDIKDASPTTKRFFLEVQDEEPPMWSAGQFITCDLPISDKRQKRWRSYSIANTPDASGIIELCIVYLDGGAGSEYLWADAEIGTEIKFKKPTGTFVLPEAVDQDIVMICTGTGVAPFRSMLHDIYTNEREHRGFHLIFGTRYANGILYQDEFTLLAQEHSEFRYDVALSREQHPDHYHGYLHSLYLEHYKDKDLSQTRFYLCGWQGMIDEAVANLMLKLKADRTQIRYELYG